jgi:hypothetical protein
MLASAGLSIMLLLGGSGSAMADHTGHDGHHGSGPNCQAVGAPNAMGMQMQHAAQRHGGIAGATQWHNERQGDDLTVGEHQQMVKEACWANPSGK